MSNHEELGLHICQKSCSQTLSNQFNILYTLLQQKGENANQLWSVPYKKTRVRPEMNWLIFN